MERSKDQLHDLRSALFAQKANCEKLIEVVDELLKLTTLKLMHPSNCLGDKLTCQWIDTGAIFYSLERHEFIINCGKTSHSFFLIDVPDSLCAKCHIAVKKLVGRLILKRDGESIELYPEKVIKQKQRMLKRCQAIAT
jgi:hypothetical protein